MIQAWLAKNAVKLGVVGVIVALIFSLGFWTSSKFSAKKIERLKVDYAILLSNNQQCLDQNERAFDSMQQLEAAITAQNEAFTKLASDSADRLAKQRLESRLALEAYRRATQESGAVLEAEKAALLARMALLTASESCHEAWGEVVK